MRPGWVVIRERRHHPDTRDAHSVQSRRRVAPRSPLKAVAGQVAPPANTRRIVAGQAARPATTRRSVAQSAGFQAGPLDCGLGGDLAHRVLAQEQDETAAARAPRDADPERRRRRRSRRPRGCPPTIAGMSGSTVGRTASGRLARIRWPRSPVPVKSSAPPPARRRTGRRAARARPPRRAGSGSRSVSRSAKIVPAIVRPTVPPICWKNVRLLVATPIRSAIDRVLDDEREDRERRPDADPGERHPEPQDRPVVSGAEVRQQEQADREQRAATRRSGLVAAGPGHDLARGDRADDEARRAAAGCCSRIRSRLRRRRPGTSGAGR